MRMEEEMRRNRRAQLLASLAGPGWARRGGCHRDACVICHCISSTWSICIYDIDRLQLWYISSLFLNECFNDDDMSPLNFLLCIWDQALCIAWWLFASFSGLTIIQNSCSTQYRKSIFWPPSSPFVSCFPSTHTQNLDLGQFMRNLLSSMVNTHLSRMKSKYKHWIREIQIALLAKYKALMCSPQKVKAGSCWLWSLRVGTSFYQPISISKWVGEPD